MQFTERLKLDGAAWVRSQNFWLFGTAAFKDGSRTNDSDAISDAKHFFNILDRQILKRKDTSQGKRLDRLVFLEHGCLGTNTHIHFFIKGYDLAAIMRAGGWSNAETVSRYLRFSQHNIWN